MKQMRCKFVPVPYLRLVSSSSAPAPVTKNKKPNSPHHDSPPVPWRLQAYALLGGLLITGSLLWLLNVACQRQIDQLGADIAAGINLLINLR